MSRLPCIRSHVILRIMFPVGRKPLREPWRPPRILYSWRWRGGRRDGGEEQGTQRGSAAAGVEMGGQRCVPIHEGKTSPRRCVPGGRSTHRRPVEMQGGEPISTDMCTEMCSPPSRNAKSCEYRHSRNPPPNGGYAHELRSELTTEARGGGSLHSLQGTRRGAWGGDERKKMHPPSHGSASPSQWDFYHDDVSSSDIIYDDVPCSGVNVSKVDSQGEVARRGTYLAQIELLKRPRKSWWVLVDGVFRSLDVPPHHRSLHLHHASFGDAVPPSAPFSPSLPEQPGIPDA